MEHHLSSFFKKKRNKKCCKMFKVMKTCQRTLLYLLPESHKLLFLLFLGIKITMSIFCCYKMWLLIIKKLGLKTNHHGVWSLIFKQPYCNNQLGTWIFNLISIFYVQHSWVASNDDDFAIFQLSNFNLYPNCIFTLQTLFEIQSSLNG